MVAALPILLLSCLALPWNVAGDRASDYATADELRFHVGDISSKKRAFDILTSLSRGDDDISAKATADLSQMYLFGEPGVIRRDLSKAFEYAQTSASKQSSQGNYIVSFFLNTGILAEVPQNISEAIKHLYTSARAAYIPALMALGFRHLVGYEAPHSCPTALNFYKIAAEEALDMALSMDTLATVQPLGEADRLSDNQWRVLVHYGAVEEDQREYLLSVAKRNDASGTCELGLAYLNGMYGFDKDVSKALQYLNKAYDLGNPSAAGWLGKIYLDGIHTNRDDVKAVEYLTEGVSRDDPLAMALLGKLMIGEADTGANKGSKSSVSHDTETGLRLLSFAADMDEPEALYELAAMYRQQGQYYEALHFYQKAMDAGSVMAYYDLGQMLENGQGVEKSCESATYAYKYVAEAGPWVDSIRNSLKCLRTDDYESALLMLSMAAEEGYELAQFNAAWLLESGKGYSRKDRHKKAMRYYEMSLLQGGVAAHAELGWLKEHGAEGIDVDLATAANHFALAYMYGDLRAGKRYARMLETGRGVRKDMKKAEQIYKQLLAAKSEPSDGISGGGRGLLQGLMEKTTLLGNIGWTKVKRWTTMPSLRSLFSSFNSRNKKSHSESTTQPTTTATTADSKSEDGNLFFVSDKTDGLCLSVTGQFRECRLDSLLSFAASRLTPEGEAIAGFVFAPFASGTGLLASPHQDELPYLVRTQCDVPTTTMSAGKFAHCEAGEWGMLDDHLVMHNGRDCVYRHPTNGTAILQPCSQGATALEISSTGTDTGTGGILLAVTDKELCLVGSNFAKCDAADNSQRWGLELQNFEHNGLFQFYRTNITPQDNASGPCLIPAQDGQLYLDSCQHSWGNRWHYQNGLLKFRLDSTKSLCVGMDNSSGDSDIHSRLVECDNENVAILSVST